MKTPPWGRPVLLALLLVLLVAGGLAGHRYWRMTHPEIPLTTKEEAPRQRREVRLYFGGPDGMVLVAEPRQLENCPDDQTCLLETVQALVAGPAGDLVPILPSQTRVRGISEQNGVASVDFSRALVTGHPGGSVSEMLTLYGLTNTLVENFPYIRQVRILIEGQAVESIKGHVDLRQPVAADFRLVRRRQPVSREEAASASEAAAVASAADRDQAAVPPIEEDPAPADEEIPGSEEAVVEEASALFQEEIPPQSGALSPEGEAT
jgi:hypothetical protein